MAKNVVTLKRSTIKQKTILIDFDGVISKNSILYNFRTAYQFINQYTPVPYESVFHFLKSTTAFSMKTTLDFLFTSLGISDISELQQEQLLRNLYKNYTTVEIEEHFYHFLDFCDKMSIRYYIFSSADKVLKEIPEFCNRVGIKNIYNLKGRSKADSSTYLSLARDLNINLEKAILIDDTPLALQVGKLNNLTTIMMINDVFTLEDFQTFKSYIDYKINSFSDLGAFL
jgi:FMN phosphatase YigB (HAD superfamily)